MARVHILHSLANREEKLYDRREIERAYLSPQTRVYLHDPNTDSWTAGRVIDYDQSQAQNGLMAYVVRLPNHGERVVLERDLEARSFAPVVDPTEVLATGGAESQYLHDRRKRALSSILGMRSAARGLEGLVSASVELLPHQVEVVRRVLDDPLQRYLLADEVGLGKTIEACAIVKQVLEEEPERRVAIVVPASLVWQWDRELSEKFDVEAGTGGQVVILTPDGLPRVAAQASEFEMLVVDEAHHLVGESSMDGSLDVLRKAAHAIPRLLLLSATPIFGRESSMLELLHLLDKVSYPLQDMEGFRGKLQRRQEFGELLLALDPDIPPAVLRPTITGILELTQGDEIIGRLGAEILEHGIDPDSRRRAVRALKVHVSDTYRLHQRLLRTRRSDVQWPDRHCVVDVEVDGDSRIATLELALEDWREESLRHAGESEVMYLADVYADLLGSLGQGVDAFQISLEARKDAVQGSRPCFPGEPEWLNENIGLCLGEGDGPTRLEQVAGLIHRTIRSAISATPVRYVAFTSSTAFAERLVTALRAMPWITVTTICTGMEHDAIEEEIDRFLTSPHPSVLIGDVAAEEGLNLQGADGVFLLDLPIALSRLEQRIGRLDRYGRKLRDIKTLIFLPDYDEEAPWAAWLTLLDEAFNLFGRSISDLQFLLEEFEREIRRTLFVNGPLGLSNLIEPMQERLADERRRLDQQYALDQLDLEAVTSTQVYHSLDDGEGREESFGRDLDDWLFQVLRLSRSGSQEEGFVVHWRDNTLAPVRPWKLAFDPALGRRVTYQRSLAVKDKRVRLIRPGFRLVEATEQFLRRDDRGTAFATLRADNRWPSNAGLWLGFQMAYVVEIDEEQLGVALNEAPSGLSRRAILRQARALLPSWIGMIDIDSSFQPVTDPLLIDILHRPYDDRIHRNLGSRPELMASIIGRGPFVELCRRAREESEALLRRSEVFQADFEQECRKALDEMDLRVQKINNRARALALQAEPDPEHQSGILAANAIIAGLKSPRVRLEAIGFVVVTNDVPGIS